MANRFQVNDRMFVYLFLVERDGEYCVICGPGKKHKKLEINHDDQNPFNNSPDNLHLICPQHNKELRKLTPRQQKKLIKDCCAKNVCVREKLHGNPATAKAKQIIDYTEGSAEMKANTYFEGDYREWVLDLISRVGAISKKEAINSGAETIGCSQASVIRYLEKLTSAVGVLNEVKDPYGKIMIDYKPHLK